MCVYIFFSFLKLVILQSFQKHKLLRITIAEVYCDFSKQILRTPGSFKYKPPFKRIPALNSRNGLGSYCRLFSVLFSCRCWLSSCFQTACTGVLFPLRKNLKVCLKISRKDEEELITEQSAIPFFDEVDRESQCRRLTC